MTRRGLTASLATAAALAGVLGLLVSACAGDPGAGTGRRGQQAATLAMSEPAVRGGAGGAARDADRAAGRDQPMAPARWRLDVSVYYLRTVGTARFLAPESHQVPYGSSAVRTAGAAVAELLAGKPRYLGARRPFPEGTRLLGLGLAAGTARVNLSREALAAASGDGYPLQALVWTVTQVPPVKRVVVEVEGRSSGMLDGRPVARLLGVGAGGRPLVRDRKVRLAPILLREPNPTAAIAGNRVVVKGEARVAAGTVGLRLRDRSGQVISQGFATLQSGAEARGMFSGALQFTPPRAPKLWTLEAFEASPTDASVTYSIAVPVWVGR